MTVTVGAANIASVAKQSVEVISPHEVVKGACQRLAVLKPAVLLSAAMLNTAAFNKKQAPELHNEGPTSSNLG